MRAGEGEQKCHLSPAKRIVERKNNAHSPNPICQSSSPCARLSSGDERISIDELELREAQILAGLDQLQTMLGGGPFAAIQTAARHVSFLRYWYRRGDHRSYEGDVADLQERDLPGIAEAVDSWQQEQLDKRLVSAIQLAWDAQHYAGAVRQAFIVLEQELRESSGIEASRGLTGGKLVTEAFRSQSSKSRSRGAAFSAS